MFGFTITKKAELEAMSTKLANEEAKVEAANKKFKTAVIAGSSTTGAAAVAIATHFLFGNGRKLNRDKIKNFDQVVEERDNAITAKTTAEAKVATLETEKTTAEAKVATLETEKKGLESTCELLAGSAYNVQVAAVAATGGTIRENSTFQRACYDHDLLMKKTFNTKSDEEFMKLRKDLFKSFTDSIKELEKLDAADEDADEAKTDEAKTDEAKTDEAKIAAEKKAEAIKNAEAVRNTAYQKAEDAKTVFETAEAALNAVTDPNNIPTDIQKAYDDAKAVLDTATTKLKEADEALKALQNNNE